MSTGLPDIRRCKCGAAPIFHATEHRVARQIQLRCSCGNRGATLFYTKPEDEILMQQAAIDGWNLAD